MKPCATFPCCGSGDYAVHPSCPHKMPCTISHKPAVPSVLAFPRASSHPGLALPLSKAVPSGDGLRASLKQIASLRGGVGGSHRWLDSYELVLLRKTKVLFSAEFSFRQFLVLPKSPQGKSLRESIGPLCRYIHTIRLSNLTFCKLFLGEKGTRRKGEEIKSILGKG